MNVVLTVLLTALVLGYAGWLAVRLWRRRGASCGSCGSCPYAGSCGKKENKD